MKNKNLSALLMVVASPLALYTAGWAQGQELKTNPNFPAFSTAGKSVQPVSAFFNRNAPASKSHRVPVKALGPTRGLTPPEREVAQKGELIRQVCESAVFYTAFQAMSESAIPDAILSEAKGVLIVARWSPGAGPDATRGEGVALRAGADHRFSRPVFYEVNGRSPGAAEGVRNTRSIVLLMSDRALALFSQNKFESCASLKVVTGESCAEDATLDNQTDVIIYQQANGPDSEPLIVVTGISADQESNQIYYGDRTITPAKIFTETAKVPFQARFELEGEMNPDGSIAANASPADRRAAKTATVN